MMSFDDVSAALIREIDRLKGECETLRKDTERYRWLRANCRYGFDGTKAPQLVHATETGAHSNVDWREELDAAIDAAMAAASGQADDESTAAPAVGSPLAANARLVAAAPELFAALVALHRICRDCDLENQMERPTEEQYTEAMDAAEAALAAVGTNVNGERR